MWIDIPKDVQTAEIEIDILPEPGERAPAPEFSAESVRDAAAMINAAKRPVLYLGGGAINAADEIRQFAESQPADHHDPDGAGYAAQSASIVFRDAGHARRAQHQLHPARGGFADSYGARFDDRAIGKTEQFCPNAKIIHVDIDRAELGKIKQPHVAIQGDVAEVLAQLIPQTVATDRADWRQLVADLQREFPALSQPRATR